ncbi:hypothetical protein ACK3TF_004857 [Chlorella vulgaris]
MYAMLFQPAALADGMLDAATLKMLLLIGGVEPNPGPVATASQETACGADIEPYHTATKSLRVWLNHNNFRYKVMAYQRNYEWGEVQVHGLLNSIKCVSNPSKQQTKSRGGDPFCLSTGEVFLLQTHTARATGDVVDGLKASSWFQRGKRDVEIVDGQQRITTFFIIYSVLQHCISATALELLPDDVELVTQLQEIATDLEKRFSWQDGNDHRILLTQKRDTGVGLEMAMFSFCPDDEQLADLLRADKVDNSRREQAVAVHVHRWLQAVLMPDKVVKQRAHWLMNFLDALDNKVFWTTTLTPYRNLALETFINYNCESMRVMLSTADIIKVALISEVETQRKVPAALTGWQNCSTACDDASNYAAGNDWQWCSILSAKSIGAFIDNLRHVCIIQEALHLDKRGDLRLDNFNIDLVRHFTSIRGTRNGWDPTAYVIKELLPYTAAYATMITQRLYTTGSDARAPRVSSVALKPQAIISLRNLLRACGFATVIRQVHAVSDIQQGLKDFINSSQIVRGAFLHIAAQDSDFGKDSVQSQIQMMKGLFFYDDLYCNKLGRALLIQIENQMHETEGASDGGTDNPWRGKITVEHILPKKANHESYTKHFGPHAHKTYLHKLGNLSLLSKIHNSKASNSPVFSKIVIWRRARLLTFKSLEQHIENDMNWDEEALLDRHVELLKQLANRHLELSAQSQVPWKEWKEQLKAAADPSNPATQTAAKPHKRPKKRRAPANADEGAARPSKMLRTKLSIDPSVMESPRPDPEIDEHGNIVTLPQWKFKTLIQAPISKKTAKSIQANFDTLCAIGFTLIVDRFRAEWTANLIQYKKALRRDGNAQEYTNYVYAYKFTDWVPAKGSASAPEPLSLLRKRMRQVIKDDYCEFKPDLHKLAKHSDSKARNKKPVVAEPDADV